MNGPRILTLDIETAPIVAYVWSIWEQNVGLDQIKSEWSILSYCAKWLGDPKLIYEATGGRGAKRVSDDSRLLKSLHKLLDEADIVVAQNGRQFDIKKINTRLVMAGYKPYSPIKIVDTLEMAKRVMACTSNKLAWLSKHITKTKKSEHKEFPGFELWLQCLADNPKAWAEMKKYNQIDVLATEELYLTLRPWTPNQPNLAIYNVEHDGMACPKCKSTKLQKRGTEVSQQSKWHRLKCTSCGGWSRTKYNTLPKESRERLLAN